MTSDLSPLLANAIDALRAPMCVLDGSGSVVAANHAWRDFTDGKSAADSAAMADGIRKVLRGDQSEFFYEYSCSTSTEQRWFSTRVYRFGDKDPHAVVVHIDITELRHTMALQEAQQRKLQRLQNLYAAITEADQIIDSSNDLPWLFHEVCRIAVDLGGLKLAWVARPEPENERLVPVASYGTGTSFLDGIVVSTRADVPEGRGPTGTAYRENRTTINQNYLTDFNVAPWHERIQPYQWQSSGTFPVRQAGKVIALLVVYSTEANAFDVEEVTLLEKLSANLGQAAESIEDHKHKEVLEQQLRRSEETFRTLFETVNQGVVFQDTTGAILSANPAAERILGLTLAQLQGRTSMDPRWGTIHPDGSPFPGDTHPAMRAIATGQPVVGVVMGILNPQKPDTVWIQTNATPVHNKATGNLEYVYAIFDDISETVRLQKELLAQANRDFLTEVANRRHFFTLGQHELARAARYASSTALLMLDIDHFKTVNDTHGHAAGDAVLKAVAQLCKKALREIDILGRIGGEEFAILLPQTPGPMAHDVAERIRAAVQEASIPVGPNGESIRVTVSIGVSAQMAEATLDEMLHRADTALYQAKHSGRNKVCCAF